MITLIGMTISATGTNGNSVTAINNPRLLNPNGKSFIP